MGTSTINLSAEFVTLDDGKTGIIVGAPGDHPLITLAVHGELDGTRRHAILARVVNLLQVCQPPEAIQRVEVQNVIAIPQDEMNVSKTLEAGRQAAQKVVFAEFGGSCTCREIQTKDPRRHFKGCPQRKPLDETAWLKQLEWSGWYDMVGDGGYSCCPCCEGICPGEIEEGTRDAIEDRDRHGKVVGHHADCELAKAIA